MPMHQRQDIPAGLPEDIESRKREAGTAFRELRDLLCSECEGIEDELEHGPHADLAPGRFERTRWSRGSDDEGGGEISILRGRVFEKLGINFSEVHGRFSEQFAKEIPGTESDTRFWASGVSLVAHMRSPHVPTAHMNIRFIVTDRWWFGGGGDLTPVRPDPEDTAVFHAAYKAACDSHDRSLYPAYTAWCDEYFYLPHRKEPRGVGGIFFDYRNSGDWEADFAFAIRVGRAHLHAHLPIVRSRMHRTWTPEDREEQLRRRGRYAEFNLAYDRGTRFGLMTGGNPEAVLMSLPPMAAWP